MARSANWAVVGIVLANPTAWRRVVILSNMSMEETEPQVGHQRRVARELSLQRARPPAQVPGYEPERFLGVGAYGEVWVAVERNTGRRVAIKFYTHRGGLDWSLLSREVEKLAFLFADRYVVQLLGVGWDADPPYYVMEYLEKGSLADRLQHGPLPVEQAVALFEDVALGLVHAHNKGVLHCDLKPANILLDEDDRPRLADFGQSRLTTEQTPALGTLFYMAPEQADLEAVPDARWDVYALGAVLYCMLTGSPPRRTPEAADELEQTTDLRARLQRYRQIIAAAPPPTEHRRVRGVDRMLAEIVDRCLALDPEKRFANVQAVLDALRLRAARRARQPVMVVAAVVPAVLLAVTTWFAWQGFRAAVQQSDAALTERALASNGFAAQYVARAAGNELERRLSAVEQIAQSEPLRRLLSQYLSQTQVQQSLDRLNDAGLEAEQREALRITFRDDPQRKMVQQQFYRFLPPKMLPEKSEDSASWFFCDARGTAVLRIGQGDTIGRNFSWRSYFHGGPTDMPENWRPEAGQHIRQAKISAVFRSQATNRWVVAIAAPVYDSDLSRHFLGIVATTVEVGKFVTLPGLQSQFAVLVDMRPGEDQGLILQHPLYDKLIAQQGRLPDRFCRYAISVDDLPANDNPERQRHYHDPLGKDPEGQQYDRHWLARMEPVLVRGDPTGWLVIVQEAYDTAIGSTMAALQQRLLRYAVAALATVILLLAGLWTLIVRGNLRLLRGLGNSQ